MLCLVQGGKENGDQGRDSLCVHSVFLQCAKCFKCIVSFKFSCVRMVVVTLVFQMKTLTSFDEPLIELGLKPSSELL